MRILFVVVLVLFSIVNSAIARDLTALERKTLHVQIARFETALKNSDYKTVSETVPPKVLESIAGHAGISVSQLRGALTTQMQMTLAAVKLLSFDMDEGKIQTKEASGGMPYALIPTVTVMDAGQGKIEARSHTLALMDGGEWYLLRINEEKQLAILREVYPSFATVEFPAGTMDAVE